MRPDEQTDAPATGQTEANPPEQRTIMRRIGRFAAITPPAVTLLLSALSKPAAGLASGGGASSRQFKEPAIVAELCRAA